MTDCLTSPEFSYFLGLMLEGAVILPDGSVEIGPVIWEWNGNEWCWRKNQ